jgi:hypothetical protein
MKTGINTISPNPASPGTTVEIGGIGFEHMDKLLASHYAENRV